MELINEIAQNTLTFVKNPFGNYVVQFVLKLQIQETNLVITRKLMTDLIAFSKQKFSSNVIEKCLEFNSNEVNYELIDCVLKEKGQFFNLLCDQYGNYVLQKCLAVAQEPQYSQLITIIRPDIVKLSSHSEFSYKIYQRLIKKYPILDVNNERVETHGKKQNKK